MSCMIFKCLIVLKPHNAGALFDETKWERQSTLNDDDLADFEAGLSGI